jgi:hypothetical protein
LTFEEFQTIPGCAYAAHSDDDQLSKPVPRGGLGDKSAADTVPDRGDTGYKPLEPVAPPPLLDADGEAREVDQAGVGMSGMQAALMRRMALTAALAGARPKSVDELRKLCSSAPLGCAAPGCDVVLAGDESAADLASLLAGDACVHHTGTPIFHDASKGWSCCSRKVLEFDEFLAIEGCAQGQHVFVDPTEHARIESTLPGSDMPRTDWYQSASKIVVSLFAKKLDKERTVVTIEPRYLKADLVYQDGRETSVTYCLLAPVVPDTSTHKVMSTKLEVSLTKADALPWPRFEF